MIKLFQFEFGHVLTKPYISVVSPADSISTQPPGDVHTSFRSTETIRCTANGGPNNMFQWTRQGTIVSNNDVLELAMITGSDGGIYQCMVTNDAGSDTLVTSVIGM